MNGYEKRIIRDNRYNMYLTWWNGYHAQVSPKENTLTKWCETIDDTKEVELRKQKQLEEGRKQWLQMGM